MQPINAVINPAINWMLTFSDLSTPYQYKSLVIWTAYTFKLHTLMYFFMGLFKIILVYLVYLFCFYQNLQYIMLI